MERRWRDNGGSLSIFAFLMLLLTFLFCPEKKRRSRCGTVLELNLLASLSLFILVIHRHLPDVNHSGRRRVLRLPPNKPRELSSTPTRSASREESEMSNDFEFQFCDEAAPPLEKQPRPPSRPSPKDSGQRGPPPPPSRSPRLPRTGGTTPQRSMPPRGSSITPSRRSLLSETGIHDDNRTTPAGRHSIVLNDVLRGTPFRAQSEHVAWEDIAERATEMTREQMGKAREDDAPHFTQSRIATLRRKGVLPKLQEYEMPAELNETELMREARLKDQQIIRSDLAAKDARGPGADIRDDWRVDDKHSAYMARFEQELRDNDAMGKGKLPNQLSHEDAAHLKIIAAREKRAEYQQQIRQDRAVEGMLRAKMYIKKHGKEAYLHELALGRDFEDAAKEDELLSKEIAREEAEAARKFAAKLPKEKVDARGFKLYPEETLKAQHITMPWEWHSLVPSRRFPGKNWLNKGTAEAPGMPFNMNPDPANITNEFVELQRLYNEDGGICGIYPGILRDYKKWRTERMKNESSLVRKDKGRTAEQNEAFLSLQRLINGEELGEGARDERNARRVVRQFVPEQAEALGATRSSEDESELEGVEEDIAKLMDRFLGKGGAENTGARRRDDDEDDDYNDGSDDNKEKASRGNAAEESANRKETVVVQPHEFDKGYGTI